MLSTTTKHFQSGAAMVRKSTKTAAGRRRFNVPSRLTDHEAPTRLCGR